jgi:hypothetical protein
MFRIIIGILIGLLIGTYFGIKLQFQDFNVVIPYISNLINKNTGYYSSLNTSGINNFFNITSNTNSLALTESVSWIVAQFSQSSEFQSIINQIKTNPNQTQTILQQALQSFTTQTIQSMLAKANIPALSQFLWQ